MNVALALLVALACAVSAAPAQAYSDPGKFGASPLEGGGGGRYFTGAPPDGFPCTTCHRGAAPPVVSIQGLPVEGFVPQTTYDVSVTFDHPELSHGISLELVTKVGDKAGTVALLDASELSPAEYCDQDPTLFPATFSIEVGKRHVVGLTDCHAALLRFRFTAPDEPEVAFSLGIVASNGEGDLNGDGALHVTRVLFRQGERPGALVGSTGCRVHSNADLWSVGGLLLMVLSLRRSRRSRLPWSAVALAIGLSAGCARVAPYERATLARRDMELSAPADLTAGEEHAVAYREGSSGGGSAKGGGCGCN